MLVLVIGNIGSCSLDSEQISKNEHFVVVKELLLDNVEFELIFFFDETPIDKLHTLLCFSLVRFWVVCLNVNYNWVVVLFVFLKVFMSVKSCVDSCNFRGKLLVHSFGKTVFVGTGKIRGCDKV